jgi:hypothetical protein
LLAGLGGGARGLLAALEKRPVVPAVRSLGAEFEAALAGSHAAIFVLGGDVFELMERLGGRDRTPPVCVNVDLASGVSPDADGIRFLSRHVEGVISTHRRTIELGKQSGLVTIQWLFAIDSGAVERGLKMTTRRAGVRRDTAGYRLPRDRRLLPRGVRHTRPCWRAGNRRERRLLPARRRGFRCLYQRERSVESWA